MRILTISLLLTLASVGPALAHAHLKNADPAVGSTVKAAPTAVTIEFSEAVEPKFSTIAVADGTGHRVDKDDVHVPGGDAHHLSVDLPGLGAGTYTVTWKATAVDTHKTNGTFTFTVAP
ncbi:MAG: copper resistance protein CopC [Azospirillaceae bacterium]|nr:copper resistance protein CopC [Azospirillaceae bacterium]